MFSLRKTIALLKHCIPKGSSQWGLLCKLHFSLLLAHKLIIITVYIMLLKLLKVILIIKVLWERNKNGSQLTMEYIDKLFVYQD